MFNGASGEWRCSLVSATSGGAFARCEELVRSPAAAGSTREVALLFAPPKSRDRLRFVLEKATELGATHLQPVATERTEPLALRTAAANAEAWCRDATEQCERLEPPTLLEAMPLRLAVRRAELAEFRVLACAEPRELEQAEDDDEQRLRKATGESAPAAYHP